MSVTNRYRTYSVLAALFGAMLLALAPVTGGYAQDSDEESDKNAPMSGKQSATLSKRVYEIITQANELVEAEDYAGARRELDKVKAMPNLSSYETAQMWSFYGFLYFNAEQYEKAVDAYKNVLKQEKLPEGLVQQTYRTLAQLGFATEDYNQAITYANDYMAQVGPDPEMLVIVGTAYYQLAAAKGDKAQPADWQRVIDPVEQAIELNRERAEQRARETGQPVEGGYGKEQWWLLLRVAYWELNDYQQVKQILEFLVVNFPKKEYWTQLSGIYYELNNEPRQLAAYESAYDQNLFDKSSEYVQLAQLLIQAGAPYKGARVLEQGLDAGVVEENVRNLRLYSQAWQLSQEFEKAIAPLEAAAALDDSGELYSRLAQSHLSLGNYDACISASEKAIQKGDLKNTGNAYLVLGMCQFEDQQLGNAKATFRSALKYEKTQKNARSWIDYVQSEQDRIAALERSLREADEVLKRLQEEAESRDSV